MTAYDLTWYRNTDIMELVIDMTIQEAMRQKNMTRYQLSKTGGIPWATLSDICTGKTSLARCSGATLRKLSSALSLPIESVLALTVETKTGSDGKPTDQSYLEQNLPESLRRDLEAYLEGEKNNVSYLDCLWGELYGSINAYQWGGGITKEQAEYLRGKYLYEDGVRYD